MPFLALYWKQAAILATLALSILYAHHTGYVSGKEAIQSNWDKQKVVDAIAVEKAALITAKVTSNANQETQNANTKFSQIFNGTSPTPGIDWLRLIPSNQSNSSSVSDIPAPTKQSDSQTPDTVSRASFNKLESDCTETTKQLLNAQDWALEQASIYDQK